MAGYIGSKASVVSSGAERKKTFAITGTTTALTGVSYTPNFVHVFHNGIRLVDGTDYTATNGTIITLVNAAESGDEVVVVSYATFSPADAYTKAESDAEFLNDPASVITVAGSNVGIGTSFPQKELHIASSQAAIRLEDNSGTSNYGEITYTDGRLLLASDSTDALSSSTIEFTLDGFEVMRVDPSGNVGINTSSPSAGYKLDVNGAATFSGSYDAGADTNGGGVNIGFNTTEGGEITALDPNISWYPLTIGASEIKFGCGGTEAGRFDVGGNFLVGTTNDLGGEISSLGNGRDAVVAQVTSNANSPYLGKNSSGSIIYIVSGSGTLYAVNTSVQSVSDVRTKENITDAEEGLDVVMGLKPRRFDFKQGFGGDRKNVLGFIAQEIEPIFPDAVDTMPLGTMPDSPEDPYKSVGPSSLIPVLVKAIQEQQDLIQSLSARITALEVTP